MSFISKPDVTFNIIAAPRNIANDPQKVLFIGQGASGTAIAPSWVQNIGNGKEENSIFGTRTMLASAIRSFKRINTKSQVDAINIAEPTTGAAQATATVTFAGTYSVSGTIKIAIQSERYHTFSIPVNSSSTPTSLASKLVSLITDDNNILVTASANDGVVTLTSVHAGEEANSTPLRIIQNVAGISVDITSFTGGVGTIVIPTIQDLVGDVRYQTIVYPSTYPIATIKNFLDDRFNATNIILDGVAIITATDSDTNLLTLASSIDSLSICLFGNKQVSQDSIKGGALVENNLTMSSYIAAIKSLRLTEGSNIARYLVGNGISNTFGGTYMAAVPYHNTPITELSVIVNNYGWSRTQQDALNNGGVSVLGNNSSINSIIMGDIVTTYLNNSAGISDDTFKYLNYVETSSAVREYFFNNNKQQYAQTTLTDGDLIQGLRQANANSIGNYQYSLYETLSGSSYGLVMSGNAPFNYFKQNLSVSVDIANGLADISMIVPIVSQLRGINGTVQISFSITQS